MLSEIQVFISSTSDLREERETIAAALPGGFKAYLYEKDRSRREAPKIRLERVLAQSDVFACILGSKYGSVYSDSKDLRSIVEWEFETASRDDRTEILVYLKNLDSKLIEEEQHRFRERVSKFEDGCWVKDFDTADSLASLLKDDLLVFLAEVWQKTNAGLGSHRRLILYTALSLSVILLAALGLLAFADLPVGTFVGISAPATLGLAGCILLTHLFL
jgi:hypothetical protein